MIVYKQYKEGFIKYNPDVDDININYEYFGDMLSGLSTIYINKIPIGKYHNSKIQDIIELIGNAVIDNNEKFYMPNN